MMTKSFDDCISKLQDLNFPTFPLQENGSLWCNATYDTILCWPAIPANSSYTQPCPPMTGIDPESRVAKNCASNGRWEEKFSVEFNESLPHTDYFPCFILDPEIIQPAQEIAKSARKLEFIGLGLSFTTLLCAIIIFCSFRRLKVFRNQIHQQLMIATWIVVSIRLIVYVDQAMTDVMYGESIPSDGYTINSRQHLCEVFFAMLEYAKTVAFVWMFIEGFYLHNILVVSVFQAEPKFWKYCLVGWGIPIIHVSVWLGVIVYKQGIHAIKKCLGTYYLHSEYWILDFVRMGELIVNFVFLLNIIRVLWRKVMETHTVTDAEQAKKSVKAALMLLPLLGIPNILQTIPFPPTKKNLTYFAIYTYVASFSYQFQGFFIAVLYCFTNREVVETLKSHWGRFIMRHRSDDFYRRGSRPSTAFAESEVDGAKNGYKRTSGSSSKHLLNINSRNGGDIVPVSRHESTPLVRSTVDRQRRYVHQLYESEIPSDADDTVADQPV